MAAMGARVLRKAYWAGCPTSTIWTWKTSSGVNVANWDKLMNLNVEEWRREVISQDELFIKLYGQLPKEIILQRKLLVSRL